MKQLIVGEINRLYGSNVVGENMTYDEIEAYLLGEIALWGKRIAFAIKDARDQFIQPFPFSDDKQRVICREIRHLNALGTIYQDFCDWRAV